MKMLVGNSAMLVVIMGCCHHAWAQGPTPLAPPNYETGTINFRTIHTDGEVIQLTVTELEDGETEESTYVVRIPVTNAQGDVTFRAETRTRTIQKSRQVLKAVDETFTFHKLNGEKLTNDNVILKMPMQGGIRVLVLYDGQEIPEAWKALLKEDSIVMKSKPPTQRAVPLRMPAPRRR